MSSSSLSIRWPDGHARAFERPACGCGQTLEQWLLGHGVVLNTRCGGRGFCRGCRVILEKSTSDPAPEVSSCLMQAAQLPADVETIHVPRASLRDHSLHGVSAFEIRFDESEPVPYVGREGFGLAMDIGTTTLAAALWNLGTGECLATATGTNAQIRHGDNVLSRISFSLEHPIGNELLRQALLRDSILPLLRDLEKRSGIRASVITQAVAAGNPTMFHTLTGDSLAGLSKYPFRPAFLDVRELSPEEHRLPFPCNLELLPAFGPFVGSDITAGAIAAGIPQSREPILLIDFGTNGEILLWDGTRGWATATAAGPAFEGGRLRCGSPARPGVISSLEFSEQSAWSRILPGDSDSEPHGISGAAYVDFLAMGLQEGWLNPFGRMDRQSRFVGTRVIDGEVETIVEISGGVFVSEADVAELLQAKAAIAGGVATLMECAEVDIHDLSSVLVAGGFGYHLKPPNAIAIGLLPNVPVDSIQLIGNSSLGGASLLLHAGHRDSMEHLRNVTTCIELNQQASFEDHFTDTLFLGIPE